MIGNCSNHVVAAGLDLIVRIEHVNTDVFDIEVRIGNGVPANTVPSDPAVDAGPVESETGVEVTFESATTDPDTDNIYYRWDWGDGRGISDWMGPYASGVTCSAAYTYNTEGTYLVKVQAKDAFDVETAWSAGHTIDVVIPGCCVGEIRGNVDGIGTDIDLIETGIDISDMVYLVDYMFTGGAAPPCFAEANIDGSNPGADLEPDTADDIDISDMVYLVDYMFTGGVAPATCGN